MNKVNNPAILFMISLLFSMLLCSCGTTRQLSHKDELPILSQDELIRPYIKLGQDSGNT